MSEQSFPSSTEIERRRKISATLKKYWLQHPERKRKHAEMARTFLTSPDVITRRARSRSKTLLEHPEIRRKIAETESKTKRDNPEIIQRTMDKIRNNPAFRENARRGALKRYSRPEEKQKTALAMRNYYASHPESRQYLREKHLEWWNSLSERERKEFANEQREMRTRLLAERPELHLNYLAAKHQRFTSLERKIKEVLDECRLSYHHQYRVGRFWCDFALPSLKLVLEIDGERWHQDMKKEMERDRMIKILLGKEWRIVHIREKDLEKELDRSEFLRLVERPLMVM
jgi:very-short-patch-repair endonuclease